MAAIAFLCCAQWNDELSIYALAKKTRLCAAPNDLMLVLVWGRWAASELELLSRVKMYLAAGGRGEMAQNSGCGVGFLFAWYQVKNFTNNSGFHTADLSSAALSFAVTFLLEYKQGFYLGCYLAAMSCLLRDASRRDYGFFGYCCREQGCCWFQNGQCF